MDEVGGARLGAHGTAVAENLMEPGDATLGRLPVVAYRCIGDDVWTCVSVSEAIEAKFGISAREWVQDAHLWLGRVHPDDRDRLIMARLAAVAENHNLSVEYRLRTVGGRYRWVHDEAQPEDFGQESPMFHGVLTDVTNRRRSDTILSELYEASRRQVARLQDEVEERALFARILAHDLRCPLGVVRSAITNAAEAADEASVADQLALASAALVQATQLIEELLEFDRWSEDGPSQRVEVSLYSVVERAVDSVVLADRRVEIDAPDRVALLDSLLVSRALANLIDNAVKHTPEGTTVRVRVDEQANPRAIIFTVEDEGDGIDPAIADDIFRPFVSSRITDGTGHGLGLALVQRVAALLGGRVWYEELPTGGLAFHLLVPHG